MRYFDLENAYESNEYSVGFALDIFISKSTGEVLIYGDGAEEEVPPASVVNDDDYIRPPDRYELNLGRPLVRKFVLEAIPALEAEVDAIFSRRGAYRRYKDYLDSLGILEKWYEFEERHKRQALTEWARSHGIEVED